MSWSVSGSGNSTEVAESISKQFDGFRGFSEPENSIVDSAKKLIAQTLSGNIPDRTVNVVANGYQSVSYGQDGAPDVVSNYLNISIS